MTAGARPSVGGDSAGELPEEETEQSVVFVIAWADEEASLCGDDHVFIIPEDASAAQSAFGDGGFAAAVHAAPTMGGIVGVLPVKPQLIVFAAQFVSGPLIGAWLSLMPQRDAGICRKWLIPRFVSDVGFGVHTGYYKNSDADDQQPHADAARDTRLR